MSFVPATVTFSGLDAIVQGADFVRTLDFDQNLSNYTSTAVRSKFKTAIGAGGTTVLSSTAGEINFTWIDASAGQLQIHIPDTATVAKTDFSGVFDIEITHDATGFVERICSGTWTISREVTD